MKTSTKKFAFPAIASILLLSCSLPGWVPFFGDDDDDDEKSSDSYQIVVIGTQTWFARNLNYDAPGSKCYDNNPVNCEKYGRLYNWATAMTACPSGWHLPNNEEWNVLVNYTGGFSTAGTELKAKAGWNNSGNGTDSHGFSALPGGLGNSVGFFGAGSGALWWSASEDDSYDAYYYDMYDDGEDVNWDVRGKSNLFSVRCLKN